MDTYCYNNRPNRRPMHMIARAFTPFMLILAACGSGGSSDSAPQSPTTTPTALVANQDDTTLTTLRLDGKGSPVISTLSLGPVQADAIGGTAFSLGEWIFVTNSATNRVATIDPISSVTPILEDFLEVNGIFKIGQRPKRIYRDPVDKEVLWTMNEGDPITGIDTISGCLSGGSASVLHNSHLLAGGAKPHIKKTVCLSGTGEHFIAFARSTAAAPQALERAFISSKTTGLIDVLFADVTEGTFRWNVVIRLDLCDSAKEQLLGHPVCDGSSSTPNHSAPAGLYWSQATGKIYSYLSGYGNVVEIDANESGPTPYQITRKVDITPALPSQTVFHSVGITPNGQSLFLVGEDIASDPTQVIGRFGSIDLTVAFPAPLSATELSFPQLSNIRPARFQFTPDGVRIYMTQSNDIGGLNGVQGQNLRKDLLLIFDPSFIFLVSELTLPPAEMHAMDLWITGSHGAGSAKGVVVTNATPGVNGTVSLIDAATNTITATIPVGRNPKQVTVYYYGLVASDNQATPN
jgi:YVTN family beta-propeller protein